jgi:3-dehydroquinate dehydratase / shikimate dehydrogenase
LGYILVGMSYLAVAISGKDVQQACEQIKRAAKAGAQILELRIDYVEGLDAGLLKKVVKAGKETHLPIIVTCRDKAEGGAGELSPEMRAEMLAEAAGLGADYIDCEYANFIKGPVYEKIRVALDENSKCRLILSAHNFKGQFDNLQGIYDLIKGACPEAIPKLVYKADHINDCFAAFKLLSEEEGDKIVFCMGKGGMISRILTKKFGGFLSFASLSADEATAPGQVQIDEMKKLYRWDSIDEKTEVLGVIGDPVGHSLSPAVYNACFDAVGMNAVYLPILIEGGKIKFDEFIEQIVDYAGKGCFGFTGFSVTIPHKSHALGYTKHVGGFLEQLAVDIGAVNTLKIGIGGNVSGYNTDYAGAMGALCGVMGIEKHELHKVKVALVGAGGAARAVAAGLCEVGAKVTIYNRTVEKAKALAKEFNCKSAGLDEAAGMEAEVVINCTSIGMSPKTDVSPVPKEALKEGMVVFDTVYNPLETLLLKDAKAAGAKTVNGAEMFVRQAMAQFKLFTGQEADEEVMRKTVFDCLG